MKIVCFAFFLSLMATACQETETTAGKYKASLATDANGEDGKKEDPKKEDPKEDEKDKEGDEEQEAKGDKAKGQTLLQACAGCHASSSVKLNAAIIPKLDNALKNKPQFHGTVATSFESPNRADLEAALQDIK